MPYRNIETGDFGLSDQAVRALLPHVSFADGADLTDHGFEVYAETAPPVAAWNTRPEEAAPVAGQQQWALVSNGRTLADLKTERCLAVTARREAAFLEGFAPSSGPLSGHTFQCRDLADRTNWLTSQATYKALIDAGQGAVPGATFRDVENANVTVTFLQGYTFIVKDLAMWGQQIMARSWALKDAIDGATTAAAVLAVDIETGWP